MARRPGRDIALSEVSVRPAAGGAERAEWDRLMDAHHYLGFRCLFGGGVRHVATAADGRWLALAGWQCGAFKVKVRDAWIGWAPEQQFRRLRLVANNTRFLILPDARTPNLASRVLSLSLRRLSSDMEAALGHPALLAETFVDPSRFEGTCYRASNWIELGETRGYAKSGGGWVAHGRPKRVFVRPLAPGAAEALRGPDEPAPLPAPGSPPGPPSEARLRSLHDFLRQVPECRRRRGLRHSLATVLTLAAAAKLTGAQGPTAIAEFAARLTQRQLAAARAFRSPATGRLVPPSKSCVHRVLSELDPDALDDAVRRFTAAGRPDGGAVALDGKSAPLNRPGGPDEDRMFVAAVEHGSGVVRGQVGSDSAGGEILGVRRLLREIGRRRPRRHRRRPARLPEHRPADRRRRRRLRHADQGQPQGAARRHPHPRLERRALPRHHRQEPWPHRDAHLRGRPPPAPATNTSPTCPAAGRPSASSAAAPRSSPAGPARKPSSASPRSPRNAPARPRSSPSTAATGRSRTASTTSGDFSFDEDRSRIRAGKLPRNLACLSNAAIAVVRMRGRFKHQPQAHRHYAATQADALRDVLAPAF